MSFNDLSKLYFIVIFCCCYNFVFYKVGGKKTLKLKIKPFKKLPTLPNNYEDITWTKLGHAVDAIFEKKPLKVKGADGEDVQVSREELYRSVEDLCVHKMGSNLYNRLKVKIEHHTEICMNKLGDQIKNNNIGEEGRSEGRMEQRTE